jgi:hypothetical protein
MVRTNPEERPQDPAAFAEKIHACLQKAERRTAFTRSFAPAATPIIPIREKKRIAPALALAATIALLASLSALYFVRWQGESKPLGVIIGVPETEEASSLSVTASASPSPVVNQVAAQPGLVAQQSPTQAASPAPTAVAAAASAAPIISQTAQQSGLVAQQSPVQTASRAAPAATEDNVSSTPQLATNNRRVEPPFPAEGPSETSQTPISTAAPPAEKKESPPSDLPDRTAMAAKDSLRTTAAGNEQSPSSSEQVVTTRKRDDSSASKTKSHRQRLAKSSAVRARPPPLRVGSESARVLGTTPAGNLVLLLPSGRTVVTPPVPNIDDAPVISHRRVRRVARPIPLEDEPPVVVLPPGF